MLEDCTVGKPKPPLGEPAMDSSYWIIPTLASMYLLSGLLSPQEHVAKTKESVLGWRGPSSISSKTGHMGWACEQVLLGVSIPMCKGFT